MKFTTNITLRALCLIFIMLLTSCAYFNTFFNAKEYFEEAEKIRLEKDGERIPISAIEKYGKSIKKSKKVVSDFPESKYVNSAIILMAKSQFYRQEYDLAINNIKSVLSEVEKEQKEEAIYWIALCKWKKGNVQTSIEELERLITNSQLNTIKSMAYLSLSEIFDELKDADKSINYLQESAKLTNKRSQKGVIYNKLAEMAFDKKDFILAREGYENVVSFSLSKTNIENAHLQILKILRSEKKFKLATKKIKTMLTDDKFKSISGNLELELVQLYRAQGDETEIESRLETIVNSYQRTPVSAEAYYQLGQIYISKKWNLSKAKEYFTQVNKESSKSIYASTARSRVEAISLYEKTTNEIESLLKNEKFLLSDSIQVAEDSVKSTTRNVSLTKPIKSLPELYYLLADLEAFKFERYDESVFYLNKIINDFSDSDYKAKSLFALSFIYNINNEEKKVLQIKERLSKEHPESEYVEYLSNNHKILESKDNILFQKANKMLTENRIEALNLFKSLLETSEKSDTRLSTSFFLAHNYDQNAEIDSALKYYNYIIDGYPNTEHFTRAQNRDFILKNVIGLTKQDSVSNILEE